MKRLATLLLALGGLVSAGAPAAAQRGFAVKGHLILNPSTADAARADRRVPRSDGVGLGAEYVLPGGLGLGVSGYTGGGVRDVDYRTSEFTLLAEANYFLRLPALPLAPYAGVHAGLGRTSGESLRSTALRVDDRTRSQVGYQLGVRLQPTALVGFDAQWRHLSRSAYAGQDGRLDRNQFLVGLTLF